MGLGQMWALDRPRQRLVSDDGRFVRLSTADYEVLDVLVRCPGTVRWQELADMLGMTNIADHHRNAAVAARVHRINRKVRVIDRIPGVGYALAADATPCVTCGQPVLRARVSAASPRDGSARSGAASGRTP